MSGKQQTREGFIKGKIDTTDGWGWEETDFFVKIVIRTSETF